MTKVRRLEAIRPPAPNVPTGTPQLVVMSADDVRRMIGEEIQRVLSAKPTAPAQPVSDWISADEAASILGVQKDYLRKYEGLTRYGTRRVPRYRRSEVEALLRDSAHGT